VCARLHCCTKFLNDFEFKYICKVESFFPVLCYQLKTLNPL
jgi:hypothetical protein